MTGQEVLYIVIAIAVSLAVIILEAWALWYATNPETYEKKTKYTKEKISILEAEKEFYKNSSRQQRKINDYLLQKINEIENDTDRS